MRRVGFIVLFVFSVVLNVTVAVTLGWHLWRATSSPITLRSEGPTLTEEDFSKIRDMVPANMRRAMMEMRQQALTRRLHVLEAIARDPRDTAATEQDIAELQVLRGKMDREAFERIRTVMVTLPAEKRQAFLEFLKTRCCMGPGMGPGMGRGMGGGPGGRGPCPVRLPEN